MPQAEQKLEAHENIEVMKMTVAECLDAIKANRISDAELCYAVLQAVLNGFVFFSS